MGSLTPYDPRFADAQDSARAGTEWHEVSTFLSALKRRWRLFAAVFTGFVALVAVTTILLPKTYATNARLMAGNPSGSVNAGTTALPILNALILQNGEQSAETLATLAQQEDIAATVAQKLQLKMSPGALLNHVSVKPIVNTAILELSVRWPNAEGSAKIANAFADAFTWRERDFVRSQAIAALGFLSSELPRAESAMRQTAADLASFQASNGFVDANTHTQDLVSHATGLESKIETTTLDKREAQALLDNVNVQLAALPTTVNTAQQISVNPVLADLRQRLEQVDIQLQSARRQYTEQHPLLISLTKQHDDLVAAISRQPAQINSGNTLAPNPLYQNLQQQAAQYKQRIDGDTAQLALLRRERANMSPILHQLPLASMRLATLQQRAKLASDVYNALEQKFNDATIAKTTAISDIMLIQPASADSASVRPNLRINLLAAILLGALIASITVLVLDTLERPIREASDTGILGLPVIARIPEFANVSRRALPWVQSMTVEAFLQLCVSLKLKNKRTLRTLAITSPTRGDGKSTIAFHLAKAMANLEQRVLLIDGDLRRPRLHEFAGCGNTLGLSDVLQNLCTLGQAVHEISPTFELLTAGHGHENPVGLMQSERFDELLRDPNGRYSIIIVDTPALAAVTDGLLVSAKADATVLVVAANSTDERQTKDVVARFASLGIENLVGVVLNKDSKRVADYSDYFARSSRTALTGRTS